MFLREGTNLDTWYSREREQINRRAREARANLTKVRNILEDSPLLELLPIAKHFWILGTTIDIDFDEETLANRRAIHAVLARTDYDWGPVWLAKQETVALDNGRYRERAYRQGHLIAKVDGVTIDIDLGPGPELKEGSKLPSGCEISFELKATVGKSVVTCAMRH